MKDDISPLPRGESPSPESPSEPARDPVSSAEDSFVSVGRVASETGIKPGTLRMWERRYGRPRPVRLPSGHRRYDLSEVRFIRRVVEAMSMGHRPGRLLRSSDEELEELLNSLRKTPQLSDDNDRLIEWTRSFNQEQLRKVLHSSIEQRGIVMALDEVLGPYLAAVGSAWSDGNLDIRHEHFASGLISEALNQVRQQLGARPSVFESSRTVAPNRMCVATLPGEEHGLGMLMVAVTSEASGVPCVILGADTPISEIVSGVKESGAQALALSVSSNYGMVRSDVAIGSLRSMLAPEVAILVGGQGGQTARRRRRGVERFSNLSGLERWLLRRWPRQGRPSADVSGQNSRVSFGQGSGQQATSAGQAWRTPRPDGRPAGSNNGAPGSDLDPKAPPTPPRPSVF